MFCPLALHQMPVETYSTKTQNVEIIRPLFMSGPTKYHYKLLCLSFVPIVMDIHGFMYIHPTCMGKCQSVGIRGINFATLHYKVRMSHCQDIIVASRCHYIMVQCRCI